MWGRKTEGRPKWGSDQRKSKRCFGKSLADVCSGFVSVVEIRYPVTQSHTGQERVCLADSDKGHSIILMKSRQEPEKLVTSQAQSRANRDTQYLLLAKLACSSLSARDSLLRERCHNGLGLPT